jgi:hypothetical protein
MNLRFASSLGLLVLVAHEWRWTEPWEGGLLGCNYFFITTSL